MNLPAENPRLLTVHEIRKPFKPFILRLPSDFDNSYVSGMATRLCNYP